MRQSLLIMLLLLASALLSPCVWANDAPMKLMSGSATPYLGPSSKIRMDSETVSISLGDKSYIVDATFNFFNSGDTVEVSVGFPKRGEGYLDERFQHADEFIKFEAWVNGTKVDVSEIPGKSSIEGEYSTVPKMLENIRAKISNTSLFARDYRWMVKKVAFPAKKKITTRVRYEAAYQDFGNCYGARYIYGTGTYWNGNIGNSKFIINCNVSQGNDMCWDQIQDESRGKKYKVNRKRINKNIIQYEITNYKPDKEDQIFMTVGCPK
jgi:hypothetical protein